MEYPFGQWLKLFIMNKLTRLNPSFSGISFRTKKLTGYLRNQYLVLILLLVEYPFGLKDEHKRLEKAVLILLLVEYPFGLS